MRACRSVELRWEDAQGGPGPCTPTESAGEEALAVRRDVMIGGRRSRHAARRARARQIVAAPSHSWFRDLKRTAVADVDNHHQIAQAVVQLAAVVSLERVGAAVCRNRCLTHRKVEATVDAFTGQSAEAT